MSENVRFNKGIKKQAEKIFFYEKKNIGKILLEFGSHNPTQSRNFVLYLCTPKFSFSILSGLLKRGFQAAQT